VVRGEESGGGIASDDDRDGADDDLLRLADVTVYAAKHGGQRRLHYQPLIDLATGRVTEVEALVRWEHLVFARPLPRDGIEGLLASRARWDADSADGARSVRRSPTRDRRAGPPNAAASLCEPQP
jgi:hypothetical protein